MIALFLHCDYNSATFCCTYNNLLTLFIPESPSKNASQFPTKCACFGFHILVETLRDPFLISFTSLDY